MGTRILMPSKWGLVTNASDWLVTNMPNPPLPEPQRYNIYNTADGSVVVDFADEQDAIMFSLSNQL